MQVEKKIEDEIARELRTSEKKKKRVNDKKNDIETSVNSVISLRRVHRGVYVCQQFFRLHTL